jgi:hypothetical protein
MGCFYLFLRNYSKLFEQRLSYAFPPVLRFDVDVLKLKNILGFASSSMVSKYQRTYNPGLPVHVSKLKK